MLAHSFNRFYAVTKFILPSMGDLNFYIIITHVLTYTIKMCMTLKHMLDLIMFFKKIEPFVIYYKKTSQIM